MFHSNDDSKHEKWRELARAGEIIQAIKVCRELNGSTVTAAKQTVESWIAEQPEGVCQPPLFLQDDEAISIAMNLAHCGVLVGDRRSKKAVERVESLIKDMLKRDQKAQTGPLPPPRHREFAGHHWLRTEPNSSHWGEIVVMQWQPGEMKWCHSGCVATGRSVDTVGWSYVAPCPMPLLDEHQINLEGLHEELRHDPDSVKMTGGLAQFLRTFLEPFRR